MALDELTLLVNRCRRLQENNESGENTDKIEEIREKIANMLSKSDEKVIIRCSYEREICMSDLDYQSYYDWVIDYLVDDHMNQEEILAKDIRYNTSNYVDWDNINITIKDKNGNELYSFH